jgi:calreticulin
MHDSKFYHISADIGKTISNENQTLIFSYTACNTQSNLKCAGSYIKLLPEKLNQLFFSADDHFYIMMGPDFCGSMNDKINCVLRKGKKEHQMKDSIHTKRDSNTHLYTLILYPDYTFEFHIDNNIEKSGNMQDQWNYFLPKFVFFFFFFL